MLGANSYSGATTVNGGSSQPASLDEGYQRIRTAHSNGPQGRNEPAGGAQPGMPQAVKPAAPTALVSLDLELHPRGVKYLFITPRGEAEVTARAVSDSLVGRLARLVGLAAALLMLWVLVAAVRRWSAARSIAGSP
jgi:hypothetical protein